MNCEQMNDLLWAFLDGELTEQEEEQMHAHLEQCADCRALLEQLQTLRTSFSDLEEIPAPEGFAAGVMRRIKAESKPKVIPLFKRPQVRALTAMAACAVLFVGLGSIRMGSSKGEAAPMAPAPSVAVYDAAPAAAEPESAMEYSVASDVESKTVEPPAAAPMEPTAPVPAPAPESSVQDGAQKQPEPVMTPSGVQLDVCPEGPAPLMGELVLSMLPEDVETVTGPLEWEERVEDGALCAQLTPNQGKQVIELADQQNIAVSIGEPGGELAGWYLVLIP